MSIPRLHTKSGPILLPIDQANPGDAGAQLQELGRANPNPSHPTPISHSALWLS